ncbi:hypothetical protein DSL64_21545 [Dyadobacter luteus]|uniref:Uncharacterized protein n=1 Tax=Dyadobacter luteus TaxID=2259619 RepID=A0A3D8Y691_9BACT|nr:hypothetical protein [Dyadobacter luteus]REA58195.1 hypothetical protein DSL64_21545 [Dyadobacter luteus]
MIEKQNTLEWLDFIITIALDFSESEVNTLSEAQYGHMTEKIRERKREYVSFFNRQRMVVQSGKNISQLVKEHHGRLLILLDQAEAAAKKVNLLNTLTRDALRKILNCVYELLGFIESSFCEYLDLDERAPEAYLAEFGRQHQYRINKIEKQLKLKGSNPELIAIVLDAVKVSTAEDQRRPTFRTVFYQREVMHGLDKMLDSGRQSSIDDALVELLIYLNFNSRAFMDYYTRHMAQKIEGVKLAREKIHQLLLDYKNFKQMHRKPGLKLSPTDSDVKKYVSNWFTQEIGYLRERSGPRYVDEYPSAVRSTQTEPFKLMVLLSVDQIGLFLRALDSLRIIKARSMNTVFECIVPFLSTPRKAEISYDSMRSKSYSFEEKDKQTVIKALESVIVWIKEY